MATTPRHSKNQPFPHKEAKAEIVFLSQLSLTVTITGTLVGLNRLSFKNDAHSSVRDVLTRDRCILGYFYSFVPLIVSLNTTCVVPTVSGSASGLFRASEIEPLGPV